MMSIELIIEADRHHNADYDEGMEGVVDGSEYWNGMYHNSYWSEMSVDMETFSESESSFVILPLSPMVWW